MSVYTSVSTTELNQLLSRYSCGKLITYAGIIEGISNSNFYVTTTTGEFVLTVYEHDNTQALNSILTLQQQLQAEGFLCARVSKTNSGQLLDSIANKPASIQQKLAGSINYPITNSLCQQIGLTLAQLHLATTQVDFPISNCRGPEWIVSVSKKLLPNISAENKNILQQELDYLSHFSQLRLPAGAVHADLFPDNVLVDNDVITGIIDFELACNETYLFDLCIGINAWCSQPDGQLDRYRMRDLLMAYTSLRQLTADENRAIPMMLRATALRFWLSRLNDVVFPTAGELTFNKDPNEFKAILLARRQRLSGLQQ